MVKVMNIKIYHFKILMINRAKMNIMWMMVMIQLLVIVIIDEDDVTITIILDLTRIWV